MGKNARHVSGYIVDSTRALDVPRVCRFAEATDVGDDEVVVVLLVPPNALKRASQYTEGRRGETTRAHLELFNLVRPRTPKTWPAVYHQYRALRTWVNINISYSALVD